MAKINTNKIKLVNDLEQALINLSGEEIYKADESVAQKALELCLTLKERDWDSYSRSRLLAVTNAIFNKIVFEANSHGIGKPPKFLIGNHDTLSRLLDLCWKRDNNDFIEKPNTAMTWIKYAINENLDMSFLNDMLYIHKRSIYTSRRFQDRDYKDQIRIAKDFVTSLRREYRFLVTAQERLEWVIERNSADSNNTSHMDVYDLMRETSGLIPHTNFIRKDDGSFKFVLTILDNCNELYERQIEVDGWDVFIEPKDILTAIIHAKSFHPLDR